MALFVPVVRPLGPIVSPESAGSVDCAVLASDVTIAAQYNPNDTFRSDNALLHLEMEGNSNNYEVPKGRWHTWAIFVGVALSPYYDRWVLTSP